MGIFANLLNGKSEIVTADMNTTTSSGMVKATVDSSSTSSSSTMSITEENAMKIPAVYQAVNIIADTIASLPVYLYKDEEGYQQMFPMDNRSMALSDMANEIMTAYNLKRNLIKDLLLYGNAYAKIIRDGEKITLDYVPPTLVTPKKDFNGYFFTIQSHSTGVTGESIPAEIVSFGDMLTIIRNAEFNSVVGKGLLDYASNIFEMAIQETEYMNNLFKNGLSAKAVLNSKTPFKKEVKEQLKRDLSEFYSSHSNAGKMLVLEGDINVLPLAMTPTDIKLIESKQFSISEISRYFNIPKHLLALDRQQGTYSNIVQERLQLLQNTLTPYVIAIESALNQKLLTEEEQAQGYYFQFNTLEMMKLTPEDNANYMLKLYEANVVTLEEVRLRLNLGGDEATIAQLKQYDMLKNQQLVQQVQQNVDSNMESTIEAEAPKADAKKSKEETTEENKEKENKEPTK